MAYSLKGRISKNPFLVSLYVMKRRCPNLMFLTSFRFRLGVNKSVNPLVISNQNISFCI